MRQRPLRMTGKGSKMIDADLSLIHNAKVSQTIVLSASNSGKQPVVASPVKKKEVERRVEDLTSEIESLLTEE